MLECLIPGRNLGNNVVVVDWRARRALAPGDDGYEERAAMTVATTQLREVLAEAMCADRITDAARAVEALRAAGVAESELEPAMQAILLAANRKLRMAKAG